MDSIKDLISKGVEHYLEYERINNVLYKECFIEVEKLVGEGKYMEARRYVRDFFSSTDIFIAKLDLTIYVNRNESTKRYEKSN